MPRSGHDHVAAMVEAWGSQRLSRDRRLSSYQFGDRGLVMAHGEHPTVWNSPFDANGSTSQSRVKAATLAVEMTIVAYAVPAPPPARCRVPTFRAMPLAPNGLTQRSW